MKQFYVWVVALTALYEKTLLSDLINNGYTVSSSSESGKVNADIYNSAALFALKVSKEGFGHQQIHTEITNIMANMNAYYYSIIVSEVADAIWMSCNIDFNQPMPTIVEPKKRELN